MRIALLLALAFLAISSVPVAAGSKSAPRPSVRAKTAEWKPVVPFIEDDFGRALALAKERKRPVFIEGWAPW